jgi:tetratricopeptide (TPR) repeat protein
VSKTLVGDVVRPSWRSKQRDIPASLEAICLKAMSTEPEERYQNVDGIINEINSYQRGFSSKAENASFLTEASLFYKRNNMVLNTVGIFLIILIFSISTFVFKLTASRHHAVTAELQTRVTLEKLQRENEKREEAEAAAFKRWMIQARANFYNGHFSKALSEFDAALSYRPSAKEALRFKAESALGQMKFQLFIDTAKKMEEVHKNLAAVLEVLNDDSAPLHRKYFAVQNMFYVKNYEIPVEAILKKCLSACPKDEKEILIKNIILSRNPQLTESEIHVDMKRKTLKVNSPSLKNIPYLEGSGLKHVDVSGSDIKSTRFIRDMQLTSLNISDIPLSLTGTNELNGIKYVDFSNSDVKGMPRTIGHVIELNISGCEIADYSRLLILKQIKKLTVSKEQVPDEILKELNCEIIYR